MPKGCSVIIATLGRRNKKLSACIESLFWQNFENLEIICIVPKASHLEGIDNRVRVIETNDINGCRNKNVGIKASSNDIVAFTDDDCLAHKDWIATAMNDFEENDAGAVCGPVFLLEETPSGTETLEEKRIFHRTGVFVPPWEIGTGACLVVKKSVLFDIGLFDERLGPGSRLHSAEDMDLIYRIFDSGSSIHRDPNAIVYHDKPESYPQMVRRFYTYRLGLGAFFFKIRRNASARWFFFDRFLVQEFRNLVRSLRRGRVKQIPKDISSLAGAFLGFLAYSILPKKRPKTL
ncbi:MAG: glycosyltransferase [Thermoplasmata archaeon]